MPSAERILVAVDGSGYANRAVEFAGDMAAAYDAELVVLYVETNGPLPKELQDFATSEDLSHAQIVERILETATDRVKSHGAKKVRRLVREGDPTAEIIAAANENKADVIVMGRRGVGALRGLLIGSVSHKVTQLADAICVTVQ